MTRKAPQAFASMPASPQAVATTLKRRLGLPLLVLYGTGITIGAGIYVLIGAVAGHAGAYAPWSFFLAAAIMALTVASYIELSTRFPVSAGEAAYVKVAFGSCPLSILVGFLTIGIATVSSAAVALHLWTSRRCPASRSAICWRSSPSLDLRILPMWLKRPSSPAGIFREQ